MSWLSQTPLEPLGWVSFYVFMAAAPWVVDRWVVEPIARWREERAAADRQAKAAARELARIERDAAQSVRRIETAFVETQGLIRDEARRSRS